NYLDRFIEFPGAPGMPEQDRRSTSLESFFNRVREERFDVALQMHGSGLITNPLVSKFGARVAAGYCDSGGAPMSEWFLPFPARESEIRQHLRLMEFLGVSSLGDQLEFPLSDDDRGEFEYLRENVGLRPGTYLCVHPGAQLP